MFYISVFVLKKILYLKRGIFNLIKHESFTINWGNCISILIRLM
jgi:hypothetical protein